MPAAGPAVDVTLLGGIAVRRDGTQVGATSTRAVALLAYLAVHAPAPQPRQHLAALFWPDTPEAQARTNLRRELHQLRRLVPPDALEVTDASIAWRDTETCHVDVRSFLRGSADVRAVLGTAGAAEIARRGRAVLGTYAGALLPGVYDDWALDARDTLQRTCVELCDDLVTQLADRETRAALDFARRRIQLEPLEEAGYRQLMRLQISGHDRSGALTTYHRCASVLEEQLGVTPSAETADVLRGIIDLDGGPGPTLVGPAPDDLRAVITEHGLIGREDDLAVVVDHWTAAVQGRPGLVLLTGDPGVGKSRLVEEAQRVAARQGAAVAMSRCFSASGVALAPVADWLRAPDVLAARSSLDPVWQLEVDRLVPAVDVHREELTDEETGRALVDSWQQHRFYEGLSHAVLAVSRPLLLVLDDLHWCDQETLSWLTFLLQRVADRPVLVLATARSDELDQRPDRRALLLELASTGLVREHTVQPLTLEATRELAARTFGRRLDDEDAALLHVASGGYPLYVVEAARASTRLDGSHDLDEAGLGVVLRRRLSELTPAARCCAALAAAVGRDFRLDLLVEASDLDEVSVVRAVDELWRRHVLRQVGHGYDFTHDLLRDEAYLLVSPAERWLEHRRLARALESLNAADLDAVAVSLAEQLERGGRPDQAVPHYHRAAVGASRVFANAEALRLFQRCLDILLELPPSPDRDRRELDVRQAMSAPLNALRGYADRDLQATFERSVELAAGLGRIDLEVASLVGLWATTFVQGDIDGSHAIASRAIRLCDAVPSLVNQAHFSLGGSAVSLGDPELAVRELDLCYDLSAGTVSLSVGSRPEIHARAWSAHALWLLGEEDRAADASAAALRDAHDLNHPYSLVIALAYAAVTAQLRGDLVLLDETLEELVEICQRHSYAYYREWALILGGWRHGTEAGVADIRRGIAHLSASGSLTRMPYWLSLLAQAQRSVGQHTAADAALDSAWTTATQHGDRWWLPEVMRLRARSRPGDDAVDLLRRAEERAWRQSSPALAQRCRADLAERGEDAFGVRLERPNAERTPRP